MLPEPTLRQLRTFLAVVEAGSLSAAARALNLTQPAVSLALRELERMLGQRLLERDGRHAVPTAAGRTLIEHARLVRASVDEAMAAMEAHRSGAVGRVRLGAGTASFLYELPPVLSAAKARMPGLEIVVATGRSPELLRQVAAAELDVAVVSAAPLPRSLHATELAAHEMLAIFPEAMAPERAAARPEDLARWPLIMLAPGNSTRTLVDAWFARAQGGPPRAAMEMEMEEAIKVLAATGLGCGVLPEIALAGRRGPPGTVVMPLRPELKRRQQLVLRKGKVVDRGLRAVVEEVTGRLGR